MSEHDARAYGRAVGSDYDALYPASAPELQTDAAVAFISELSSQGGQGSGILEFGIGTGRLALPLARRGFAVAGVDTSPQIIEQMRAKPGGAEVPVVIGDFVSASVPGSYSVAILALNTIFASANRGEQIDCFRNAARHLDRGGRFIVEAYLLQPEHLSGGWSIDPRLVGAAQVEMQVARYDLATNRVERTLVHLRPEGTRLVKVNDCYAWPGELDLMAQFAGFVLESRYGDWSKTPFSNASRSHVSVYRLGSLESGT